jgi:hypothetical protein
MKRTTAAALLTVATVAGTAAPAFAEQTPVLIDQHGVHQVWLSASEPYDVQDHTTYWDLVSLDGMCGFTAPLLELSDMRETYFITQKEKGAAAGSSTMEAKLLDETFELTERDAAGNPVRVYRGTGDEYAQSRHDADGSTDFINLDVKFRGASDDGRSLAFGIKARMRADQKTGELTRFDASVSGCHVG